MLAYNLLLVDMCQLSWLDPASYASGSIDLATAERLIVFERSALHS